ncbi:acyclic terpene utilization AtuA family protein [Salarchaeum sp. III]|uniref:acyclic terpene utilization AtuA family protein n=1 Tax=Salarchaeum sp. III TaxID=3107927 RepID=UPI002EDA354A
MSTAEAVRLGSGAGYAGDRIEPAVELSRDAGLDYLVFECLGERTVALAEERRRRGDPGYNPLLVDRFDAVLENCARNDITIVTNMGAADPDAAAERTVALAADAGLDGLRVGSVAGSNVADRFDALDGTTFDGEPTEAYRDRTLAAHAYLGADPIRNALDADADIVLTGRVADSSLFLAPLLHEFDWEFPHDTSSSLVGQGIAAGHLLECAGQVTGGYYADPGRADVEDLAHLGFPVGEVTPDGDVTITKLPETGGEVTVETCTQQLFYEIHDPSEYLVPDGAVDFTEVTLTDAGPDAVAVAGAVAAPRPDTLKVSLGYDAGYRGVGELSYAGPNARGRAELAGDVVRERLDVRGVDPADLRVDLVGVDSLHGDVGDTDPYETRLRVAARDDDRETVAAVAQEVETLYTNGPAGGGGARTDVESVVGIVSTLVDRATVSPSVSVTEVER